MGRFRFVARLSAAVLALGGLAACGTISRVPLDAPPTDTRPKSPLDVFRFSATDEAAGEAFLERWRAERLAHGREGVTALAISAGGANGAYGAGVLIGWTEAGDRPAFDVVTGVSTGALIAPFAFLGPDWDDELRAAYTDEDAARLTDGRWAIFVRPALFGGQSLRDLIGKYVDARLLAAIAREHQTGRRLLVATTDLDAQEAIVWDMGAIALAGQTPGYEETAVSLFQTVLVASASIPGVFPPVMVDADGAEGGRMEMHVDGGVTTPFVLAPAAMSFWEPDGVMRPENLFVIVNGELEPSYGVTRGATLPILMRSFDTMSKADLRAHLAASQAFAQRNGASLRYAAIPPALGADSLAFDRESMERLLEAGRAAGAEGRAFESVAQLRGPRSARSPPVD